jgi:hypothetical protein
MSALTEAVPLLLPTVSVTGTGFAVPVKPALLARRNQSVSLRTPGLNQHLQGRVVVHGIMPTPKGMVPTATVATTVLLALAITETLFEPAFVIRA